MIHNNLKRQISILLVLLLVFSIIPMQTFAADAEMPVSENEHFETEAIETDTSDREIPELIFTEPHNTEEDNHVEEEKFISDMESKETPSMYTQAQQQIDSILKTYLHTTDISENEIHDSVSIMDWETYRTALWEMNEFDASEVVSTLTEEELNTLSENNSTFLYLYDVLSERYAADDTVSLLGTTTKNPITGVTVTDTNDNGSCSMNEDTRAITITLTGGSLLSKTSTVNISYTASQNSQFSFNYTKTGTTSQFTVGGSSASDSDSYSTTGTGGSVTIVMKCARKKSATLVLSNFQLQAIAENAKIGITYNTLGSVTVAGTAIASGKSADVPGTGAEFVATPVSGASFLGWVNDENNQLISSDASFTYTPTANTNITAVFVNSSSTAFFKNGSYLFDDLNEASECAKTNTDKIIVAVNDGTLPSGNYTIPSGVTLLIPFNDANTLCTTEPATTATNALTKPTAYRTLTMATGANIIVNGAISISGTQHTHMAKGTPFGPVGFINMASGSSITINNGANLYAWGYITGSGSVTIKSGGKVYECFQVSDWRGGSATSKMVENKERIFPLSQYYLQNVEVPMTLEPGAAEYAHMAVNVSVIGIQKSLVPFIGDSSAMFQISAGSITKQYKGDADRLVIDMNNANLTISPYTISIKAGLLGNVTLNSEDYVLPITSNMTLNANSGSTVNLSQDIAFLPGCEVNIEEGATCNVTNNSSLYVYDADDWGTYCGSGNKKLIPIAYAPSKTKTRTEADLVDAAIKVNGTVDASAGYIYTTNGSANIYSEGNGKIIQRAGTATVTYQATYIEDGYTPHEISITPAKLKNGDGGYTQTTDATTATTYNYTNNVWCSHTATSYVDADNDHKCDTCKKTVSTCADAAGDRNHTCDICGADNITNCTPGAAATCTTAQTCTECGKTLNDKLGHDYTVEVEGTRIPSTCKVQGSVTMKCSRCDATQKQDLPIDPDNHTEVIDKAVDATCTEPGKTQGKHCSVCNTVLVAQTEVPALGHKMVSNNDAVLPTYQQTGMTASQTCSICGEKTAGTVDPKVVQLNAFAASAAEKVYLEMKFFLPEEMLNGTITLNHRVTKDGIQTNDGETFNVSDLTPDDRGRYVISHGIASGEMSNDVNVTFDDANGNRVKVRTGNKIDAFAACDVTDYADLVLQRGSQGQKGLIASLLTYGRYAEIFFNVSTTKAADSILATYGISSPDLEKIDAGNITKVDTESGAKIGIKGHKREAQLRDAISLTVYFALAEGYTKDDFTFTLKEPVNHSTREKELTAYDAEDSVDENGNTIKRCCVEIENIPAAYLDHEYEIIIKNIATNEEYTVKRSVLAYLKDILIKGESTDQKNLAKAMYLYNEQANNYFGK